MTTAREQAREAATWQFRTGPAGESLSADIETIERSADAASDVWEPLLREALSHLEAIPGDQGMAASGIIRGIKRALG